LTDRQMEIWTNRLMDRWPVPQMDERADEQTDRQINR
jgi:hypothetical protein